MQVPAVRLFTHEWHPEGTADALLVHGLGSDGATMWRLASALADADVRVVAPDLRGHGLSPTTATYPLAGYTADVARLGTGWRVVVGHSLGGTVLAELLCRTGFARRAVLIDPVLRLDKAAAGDIEAGQLAEVAGRETVASVLDAYPGWDREDVQRKVAASRRVTDRVVTGTISGNLPWDLTDRPARWQTPVHVLAAGDGSVLGPRALGSLSGHEITIVGGAGHSIHRDEPEVVTHAVLAALAATEGPAAPEAP